MKFYADHVEYSISANRMIATGNVLLIEPDHQIAADRADFNPKTRLGTFYNARGFAKLGTSPEVVTSGPIDPDVQFYGETLEKVSDDTYVITNGGFTSCVQANPRWQMTSGSLRLRVDHYALLRNMMLKVKGVPALYLPYMYYPLSSDGRSTGFLMPSYGSSTYKGHTISNAFFWAINRSQDATFLHDWYSKTGQSIAGEYRYVSISGSGNFRSSLLNERPTQLPVGRRESGTGGTAQLQRVRQPEPVARRIVVRAGARRLFVGPDGRSALQHRHLPRVAAHEKLWWIGERHHARAFASPASSIATNISPRTAARRFAAIIRASTSQRPDRLIGGLPVYASVTSEYVRIESKQFNPDVRRGIEWAPPLRCHPRPAISVQQDRVSRPEHDAPLSQHVLVAKPDPRYHQRHDSRRHASTRPSRGGSSK